LCLVAVAAARPGAEYPANLHPSLCINYPFCGPTPGTVPTLNALPAANDFVEAGKALVTKWQHILPQPILHPAIDYSAHQAAEAKQMALMGLNPGTIAHSAEVDRVRQAEQDLLAFQAAFY